MNKKRLLAIIVVLGALFAFGMGVKGALDYLETPYALSYWGSVRQILDSTLLLVKGFLAGSLVGCFIIFCLAVLVYIVCFLCVICCCLWAGQDPAKAAGEKFAPFRALTQ
jgi:hypothetical protein